MDFVKGLLKTNAKVSPGDWGDWETVRIILLSILSFVPEGCSAIPEAEAPVHMILSTAHQ